MKALASRLSEAHDGQRLPDAAPSGHPEADASGGPGRCPVINQQLAELSNLAIVVTIVLYVLALIGFGADLASSSQRRSSARLAAQGERRRRRR